jgi:5-methylcytosine-specific restriction endonuclease McrA
MPCDCKKCLDCGELKSLDQFTKDSSKKDGKNIYCIPCRNKRTAKWKAETNYNEERLIKSISKQYRKKYLRIINENLTHFFYLKQYLDLFFFILLCVLKNHNDVINKRRRTQRVYNKEKRRPIDPALKAHHEQLRRCRKKSAILLSSDNLIIKQIINNRIALDSYGETKWSVDHLIPISKGGSHHQDNLQIIKLSENIAKSNHSYERYAYIKTRWAINKESFKNPLSPYFKITLDK